jgi:mRNA interferase HigB
MKILNSGLLEQFARSHSEAANQFWSWYYDVSAQDWNMPLDIKKIYATADPIPNNRAVFNIRGNKYRIVVEVNYQKKLELLRWIGTHAEYDRIDATTV